MTLRRNARGATLLPAILALYAAPSAAIVTLYDVVELEDPRPDHRPHPRKDLRPGDSAPHDHGPTWAIYGQATGETIMTDWEKVAEPNGDTPGQVRRVRDYKLTPGMAYAYEPGVLHSPRRDA